MPAIVTKQFRVRNAKTFLTNLLGSTEGGPSAYDGTNYVYLAVGKILPWDETNFGADDSNPPDPDDDVSTSFNVFRDGLAASRITTSDVSLGIRRYDWTSGTVYTQYDDQDPTVNNGTAMFFVYEPNTGDIFKCIDNNSGGQSTVRPVKPPTALIEEAFATSDGYRWKFMAETPIAARKFLTTNFAPILSVNVHPSASTPSGYSDQKIVQQRANTGSLEAYVVSSGGAGFTKHSGGFTTRTIASGTNRTTFTLDSDSVLGVFEDGALIGATIQIEHISNGNTTTGIISGYTKGTRTVVVASDLDFTPATGDTYHIGPTVWVSGDGQGANAYSICTPAGGLSKVKALTTGNSYTYATVTIDPLSGDTGGSGTSVRAIIPPPGGHGRYPADELNAFNVLINKTVNGAGTGNTYPVTNDYRVVSLIRNGLLSNGYNQDVLTPATSGANWFANNQTLHLSTYIVCNTTDLLHSNYSTITNEKMQVFNDWNSGDGPLPDDEIQGVNSGAKARIVEFNTDGRGILNITNVVANSSGGGFMYNEALVVTRTYTGYVPTGNNYLIANGHSDGWTPDTWSIPGTTFDVVQEGEIQTGTGEVLYVENRVPVLRSIDQRETATIVIEF